MKWLPDVDRMGKGKGKSDSRRAGFTAGGRVEGEHLRVRPGARSALPRAAGGAIRIAPKLLLLHGWMDMSASFQFLVDALRGDWSVLAPDWRGFGESAWSSGYLFAEYLGDLEALLDRYAPGEPANLVGHSLGGNVACIYAGARPDRVRRRGLPGGLRHPAHRRRSRRRSATVAGSTSNTLRRDIPPTHRSSAWPGD